MIIIFLLVILLIVAYNYRIMRAILFVLLTFILMFGQRVEIVGNNMIPGINVHDIVYSIKPVFEIYKFKLIDLRRVPILNTVFQCYAGKVIVVKQNIETEDSYIIHPRLIRVFAQSGDHVKFDDLNVYRNNKKIIHKRYGGYIIETNGQYSYLILPSMKSINKEITVANNQILCMYDNRYDPEQNITNLLIDLDEFYSVPILNLTNITKYLNLLIN